MKVVPCPLCGYDVEREARVHAAPDRTALPGGEGSPCPHCSQNPLEASLRGPRPGTWNGFVTGFAAMPRGLYFLATTPGVKRWLAPPFFLTLTAFGALFWWLWVWVQRLIAELQATGDEGVELDPEWLERALEWLLGLKMFVWLAEAGSVVLFLLVWTVAAFWAFSIVYEAVSGPFLDEIHGRVEARWFGRDPRNAMLRPTAMSPRDCALHSAVAGALSASALVAFALLSGWTAWAVLLLGLPLPFVVLGVVRRDYGRWLLWIVRLEGGTLWVSVKAATVAALVLVLFFPLKFVPGIGYLLFGAVAGFTTAISLLDIPFERRQWSLRQRLGFLVRHAPAVVAFGSTASLLFVVPLIGPVVMVPASSIGGLWLVCRLEKSFLNRRGGAPGARPGAGTAAAAAPRLESGAGRVVDVRGERVDRGSSE